MKTKSAILLALILICLQLYSFGQTIELTFTGQEETTSNYVPTDSIFIRNITKECDTMLYGNDTILQLFPSGIDELHFESKSFELIQNYPNPFKNQTTFGVRMYKKEKLSFAAFNLIGQKVAEFGGDFSPGIHLFSFTGNQDNFYIITAFNQSHSKSIKLVNANPSSGSKHKINYLGYQPQNIFLKSSESVTGFTFSIGDQLVFVGFAQGYIQGVIQDSPQTNTNYTFQFEKLDPFVCGESFIDERDGKEYNTVLIGEQCWMAENLNIGTMINGVNNQQNNNTIEKYCYNNVNSNCENYGGMYQWDEIMQYDTTRYTQGICPDGWYLPTVVEWDRLINKAGGSQTAGTNLKIGGSTGFDALMAGSRAEDGSFIGLNTYTNFWSPVSKSNDQAYTYNILESSTGVFFNNAGKQNGFSVRCIRGLPLKVDTNIIVIDTTVYTLLSDSLELSQGIYRYEYNNKRKVDEINIGTIIIGVTDIGYLRKVEAIIDEPPILTLETSQATFEDLFIQGSIYLPIEPESKDDVFEFEFTNDTILNDGNISLILTNAYFYLDPNFEFDIKFGTNFIRKFLFQFNNAQINYSIDAELIVSNAIQIEKSKKIGQKFYLFPALIGGWPVWVAVNMDLYAVINLYAETSFSITGGYSKDITMSLGAKYEYGTWEKIWNYQSEDNFHPISFNGNLNLEEKLSLVPELLIRVYSVAGPYGNLDLYEKFIMNLAYPSYDLDAALSVGLDANWGFKVKVFGYTLAQKNYNYQLFEETLWNWPDELQMVSGNNQTGQINQQLTDPIKVKVIDNYGNTFANIPVHFEITQGGGSLSEYDVITNENGIAQTYWTMGPTQGENLLVAKVYKADGSNINGTPLEFTASTGGGVPCPGIPTITYEGQVYNTVLIGEQCWLKENLNVGIMINSSQYQQNNGIIEKYCYDNDPANCDTYGGLYQWNEVMQYVTIEGAQGICPEGWYIPTDDDWKILEGTVDSQFGVGDPIWDQFAWRGFDAGGNLKETGTTHWYSPNTGATNFSGFTALPGGARSYPSFQNLGINGSWWSSTESVSGQLARMRALNYSEAKAGRYSDGQSIGDSVRCLKD